MNTFNTNTTLGYVALITGLFGTLSFLAIIIMPSVTQASNHCRNHGDAPSTLCLTSMSVDPSSTSGNSADVTVSWEATNGSPAEYTEIQCNLRMDGTYVLPQFGLGTAPDTSPVSINGLQSDGSYVNDDGTVDFTVTCEVANDDDGPSTGGMGDTFNGTYPNTYDIEKSTTFTFDGGGGGGDCSVTANDDEYTTGQGEELSVSAPGVLDNDSTDGSDDLEVVYGPDAPFLDGPSDGSVSFNPNGNGEFDYTPDTGFTGTDSFEYISGNDCGSETATVEVTVGGNDAPNASDDGNNTAQICSGNGSPLDIDVLDNDSDPDGSDSSLTVTSVTQPSNGSVVINDADAGILRYTPGSTGEATFDYTIEDADGATATATVTVNVTSGCGNLRVKVEDPSGNVISDAAFTPMYDGSQLPEKTGDYTYNVQVDETPRLGIMNQSYLVSSSIPSEFSETAEGYQKTVEIAQTANGPQAEPDDHPQSVTKSKLASDLSPDDGDIGGGDSDSPTAALDCVVSQDQDFGSNCQSQHGQDAFPARFTGENSTDPDGDIDTYGWASESGSIDETTTDPDNDIEYCIDTADQGDVQDNLALTVTDESGNTDSASKSIGTMCPIGGGGNDDGDGDNGGQDPSVNLSVFESSGQGAACGNYGWEVTDHTGNFSSWEIEETITTNIGEAGEQTETNTDSDSWDPNNYPSGGYQTDQHPSEYQVEIQLNGPDGPVTEIESADVPENAPC